MFQCRGTCWKADRGLNMSSESPCWNHNVQRSPSLSFCPTERERHCGQTSQSVRQYGSKYTVSAHLLWCLWWHICKPASLFPHIHMYAHTQVVFDCLMLQPDSPLYIIFLIKAEASRSSALPQCVWRCVSVCLSSRTNIVPERMWASLLFCKIRNQFWCCATSVSEYKNHTTRLYENGFVVWWTAWTAMRSSTLSGELDHSNGRRRGYNSDCAAD